MKLVGPRLFACIVVAGYLISACSNDERRTTIQGIVAKDSLIKRYPVLESPAGSFEDLFAEDGVIQLETRKENPIGYSLFRIGSSGQILVVDYFPGRSVYLFDSSGTFLRIIGGQGRGPGEYETPYGACFDGNDNIYLVDEARKVINKYDRSGRFVRQLSLKGTVHEVLIGRNNVLYTYASTSVDPRDKTVHKLDSLGIVTTAFAPLPETYSKSGGVRGGGIVADSSGRLFHITPYEYQVRIFSEDGILLDSFESAPSYFRPFENPTHNPQASAQSLGAFHSAWTHIWSVHLYDESILMVITGEIGLGKSAKYVDMYDLAGNPIQMGVSFFPGEAPVFSRGDCFYVLVHDAVQDDGLLLNPRVIRFRLRKPPAAH